MAPGNRVLVIGGAGYVGYHVATHFLSDDSTSAVAITSRNAESSKDKIAGATYHNLDISDAKAVEALLDKLKPNVVINSSTPSPTTGTPREYHLINVQGTRNLLDSATRSESVKVFIFTSSSTMCKGPEHVNFDETAALANEDPRAAAYSRSKADADDMVRAANNPPPSASATGSDKTGGDVEGGWKGHLLTGCLRFPIVYGPRDAYSIPGILNALATGQTKSQLGNGTNVWNFCSTTDTGRAHVLLAKALLDLPSRGTSKTGETKGPIDGQAYHINDGVARNFWGHVRKIWKLAGHEPPKPLILPVWFIMPLAIFLEYVFWIFTFGTKRPQLLGKQQAEYACYTHTYSIEKAKQRLGFQSAVDYDTELKLSVDWALNEGGWKAKVKDKL